MIDPFALGFESIWTPRSLARLFHLLDYVTFRWQIYQKKANDIVGLIITTFICGLGYDF